MRYRLVARVFEQITRGARPDATAIQSDGSTTTATGNFEVVGIRTGLAK